MSPNQLVRALFSRPIRIPLAIFFVSFLLLTPATAQSQAHVRIEVEPSRGTVEDVFELRVILEGSNLKAYGQPKIEESYQFTLAYGGVMQNQIYVNGKGSESKIFSYELSPLPSLKPGKYKIPQITFESPSKAYDLNEPEIEIVSGPSGSGQVRNPAYEPRNLSTTDGGGTIDFSQSVDEQQPFIGQQVLYKTELVSTKKIASGVMSDIPFDGFWHEPLGKPKEDLRQVNQTTVRTYESAEAIFANKSGELTIPSRMLTAEVQVPLKGRRRNDAWDDLRGGFPDPLDFIQSMRTVKKKYSTKPLTLNVKPLPDPPTGTAPGTYVPVGQISIVALADRFDGKAGESISYSIELTGDGNLRPLELGKPSGKDLDHFKIYPDQPEVKTFIGGDKINFKKRFPISLIPRTSGTLELPGYSFLVFEPGQGYKVLTTPHQTITIAPADPSSGTAVIPDAMTDNARQASGDLLPQHTGPETYLSTSRPSKATLLFFILIYPAVVILVRLISSARKKLDSDQHLGRQKRALEGLNRRLKLIQNEHSAASSELFSALRIYLGDKLGFAGESATAGEIILHSESSNLPPEILSPLCSLVRELERSDYGGSALTPDRIADAKVRTVELAKKIEARKVSGGKEGIGSDPLAVKGDRVSP